MNQPRALLGLTLLLAASTATALAANVSQLIGGGKVLEHDSVIVASDKPHAADMCRGFSLTESQVKAFFKRATVIDETALKQTYQASPCEVQGHLLYQEQTFLFTISAASTGRIETSPGQYVYFGCASCKDLFDYGYVVPPAPATVSAPASASTVRPSR